MLTRAVPAEQVADVSEALHVLMAEAIEPKVEPGTLADPNDFRARCYDAEVNAILAKHEPSLRHLFAAAAGGEGGASAAAAKLLSVHEWKALLKALGFIGVDVTERDARLCFCWSRMIVVDPRTARGAAREYALPFEGFLEGARRAAGSPRRPAGGRAARAAALPLGAAPAASSPTPRARSRD